jgi:hypothetical protein
MAGIQVPLRTRSEGIYCPVSKLQFAPPPAFCMISLGSIVQRNLEMLSMLEPAAPSEGHAGRRRRRADFVGLAPRQRAFARPESELAAALRDIDIAYAADHGIRIDGNFRIWGKAESSVAAEKSRDDSLVEGAHRRRMLRDHRRQCQRGRPRCGAWRSGRGAVNDGESHCRNHQLFHLCGLI